MYCIVLEFETAHTYIFKYRKGQEINIVLEKKGFSLDAIQFMCVEKLRLSID